MAVIILIKVAGQDVLVRKTFFLDTLGIGNIRTSRAKITAAGKIEKRGKYSRSNPN